VFVRKLIRVLRRYRPFLSSTKQGVALFISVATANLGCVVKYNFFKSLKKSLLQKKLQAT